MNNIALAVHLSERTFQYVTLTIDKYGFKALRQDDTGAYVLIGLPLLVALVIILPRLWTDRTDFVPHGPQPPLEPQALVAPGQPVEIAGQVQTRGVVEPVEVLNEPQHLPIGFGAQPQPHLRIESAGRRISDNEYEYAWNIQRPRGRHLPRKDCPTHQ